MSTEANEQGTVRYIRCASCGTPNPGTAEKCTRCGAPMGAKPAKPARPATTAAHIVCPKCRQPLPVGSKFCGYCGSPLPAGAAAKKADPHSAPTAAGIKAPTPAVPPSAIPPKPQPTAAAKPAAPPAAPPRPAPLPTGEGTHVFTGLRVPRIESSIIEIKSDGTTGKVTRLIKETFIGRAGCDVTYANDMLLSPRHAALSVRECKLYLRDLSSQNGTYIKQRQDTELAPGDVFLIGREIFRIRTQELANDQGTQVVAGAPKLQRGPVTAKLERIQLSGEVIEEYSLDKPEITLGRTKGDLIFKNDPFMSGTHARILVQPGRFVLQDLKSRNGVYRKIRNEVELKDGDEFFLGEQLFRAQIKSLEG